MGGGGHYVSNLVLRETRNKEAMPDPCTRSTDMLLCLITHVGVQIQHHIDTGISKQSGGNLHGGCT